MYLRAVLLSLALSACGLGVGAVDGKQRPYAVYNVGPWVSDPFSASVDSSGRHGRNTRGDFLGLSTPSYGVLVGYRRGVAWTHFHGALDGGSSDYFVTGYLGALSLGVGSTTDAGSLDLAYGTGTLKGGFEYGGPYLEPGLALLGNDVLYVAATCSVIFGEVSFTPEGRSAPYTADVHGYRPGLRIALGGLPLGPVVVNLSADVRYLITSDVDLMLGGGTTPAAYGGLSTAFALNFVL
ncbi:MAG: hypothetical protein NT062_15480 [Proteobacteria bacterium]|nr:hypothetical protein [Pseudomonadota bacterium]